MSRFINVMGPGRGGPRKKRKVTQVREVERDPIALDALPMSPQQAGVAKQVLVLPKTTITKDSDSTLYDEQMVAKIEIAMLKGYRDAKMLAGLLRIVPSQAERYMKRVYARWEVVGTANDLKRVRGEGLARMAMMERKYWQIVESSSDPRARIVALQSLLQLNQQRDLYNGVTQKTMETISQRTEGHEIQARLAKQSKLAAMAKQLAKIISEEQQEAAGPSSSFDSGASYEPGDPDAGGSDADELNEEYDDEAGSE